MQDQCAKLPTAAFWASAAGPAMSSEITVRNAFNAGLASNRMQIDNLEQLIDTCIEHTSALCGPLTVAPAPLPTLRAKMPPSCELVSQIDDSLTEQETILKRLAAKAEELRQRVVRIGS